MTDGFHTVSDCSVLDSHGRVVGVMCDHQVAHELVDMAERDEEWVDPEVLGDRHQEVVDGYREALSGKTLDCVELRKKLENVQRSEFNFRQWASARISELEELLGEQGKETGRAKIE